jgi:prevent-host-death family protein
MTQTIAVTESYSLADFQQNPAECISRLRQTRQPIELTVNGTTEMVLLDADSFKQLLEAADYADAVEGIKRGLEDIQAGRTRPAKEFFEEMRVKYNIPAK